MILSCCNVHHLAQTCTILYSESLEFIYFQRFYNLSISRFWIKMTKPRRSRFFFNSSQNVEDAYNTLHWPPWRRGWHWRWGGCTCTQRCRQQLPRQARPWRCLPGGRRAAALLSLQQSPHLLLHRHNDGCSAIQYSHSHTHRVKDPVQHSTSARVVSLFLEEYWQYFLYNHPTHKNKSGWRSWNQWFVPYGYSLIKNKTHTQIIISSSRDDLHVSLVCKDINVLSARGRKWQTEFNLLKGPGRCLLLGFLLRHWRSFNKNFREGRS